MQTNIEIHLLGPVEIKYKGKRIEGFESRKALALFCYLVQNQQPVLRSHIVEMFWGDKSVERGRSNLSRVLHNNAMLLPDTHVNLRNSVQFIRSTGTFTDISFFDDLSARNDISSLVDAVKLHRGEFMEGIALDGCPEFEIWLTTEREMWNQRIVEALAALVAYYRTNGDYQEGLKYALQLLQFDPWREEIYRESMLMYALIGERSAALTQYEKCSQILANDLGIKPSAETTALYYRVRSGEMRPKSTFVHNSVSKFAPIQHMLLPPPIENNHLHRTNYAPRMNPQEVEHKRLIRPNGKHLASHDDANPVCISIGSFPLASTPITSTQQGSEFDQIIARLADPGCRLLTLVGANSETRQRLLHQIVASSLLAFRDGVCWVVSSSTAKNSLLVDIADSLNLTIGNSERHLLEDKVDTAMTWLFKHLRSKEFLFVFADAERYGKDALIFDAILRRAPQTKILTSARMPLNATSEWIFDI